MTQFHIAYFVNPPETVIHDLQCSRTQACDFIQTLQADSAQAMLEELRLDYEDHDATEVKVHFCTCVTHRRPRNEEPSA